LVDSVRRKKAAKRGGDDRRRDVELDEIAVIRDPEQLLAVHDVLDRLAETDAESAELVKLRYFAGFTMEEAAGHMGISLRKAKYIWAYARNWLRVALKSS
jgi:DNA-directed RNA polymerase specialized sigma24 family protein